MSRHERESGRRRQLLGAALVLVLACLQGGPSWAQAQEQEHRAEQDKEITYWLLQPSTHQFRISHDFTAHTPGQRYVHNFVRQGSQATGTRFYDLDTGQQLVSYEVTGKEVNDLGFYPYTVEDESAAIQAELPEPIAPGHSVRIRVVETYTDAERYTMDGDELLWDRTLGRPYNVVTLPPGWMLTAVSPPAVIHEDGDGNIALRFINPRNNDVHVVLRARRRP
jgi:hypothetical protein